MSLYLVLGLTSIAILSRMMILHRPFNRGKNSSSKHIHFNFKLPCLARALLYVELSNKHFITICRFFVIATLINSPLFRESFMSHVSLYLHVYTSLCSLIHSFTDFNTVVNFGSHCLIYEKSSSREWGVLTFGH